MGQNRENRKSNTRRLREFEQEVYEDLMVEKNIGYRQVAVTIFIGCLVVLREAYYPSHLYIKDLFFKLIAIVN